jgi:hypothetical protein
MKIDVVKGTYGHLCLSVRLDGHSLRIAGPKPWGEGKVIHSFDVDLSDPATRKVLVDALEKEKVEG